MAKNEKTEKLLLDAVKNWDYNIKGYANMQYVLYGLAIYAIVVLYLMIFKVEIDLRRIPKAISNDKE